MAIAMKIPFAIHSLSAFKLPLGEAWGPVGWKQKPCPNAIIASAKLHYASRADPSTANDSLSPVIYNRVIELVFCMADDILWLELKPALNFNGNPQIKMIMLQSGSI